MLNNNDHEKVIKLFLNTESAQLNKNTQFCKLSDLEGYEKNLA